MQKGYVLKRILYTVFIFFIVVTLNFFIPRIGVEDPAERYYPPQGNMSEIEYDIVKQLTREQYGFDVSTFQQYLRYVDGLLHGDLGVSFQPGSPKVADLIASRLPWTLVLSVSTLLIGLTAGLLIGSYAAWKRGQRIRLCSTPPPSPLPCRPSSLPCCCPCTWALSGSGSRPTPTPTWWPPSTGAGGPSGWWRPRRPCPSSP